MKSDELYMLLREVVERHMKEFSPEELASVLWDLYDGYAAREEHSGSSVPNREILAASAIVHADEFMEGLENEYLAPGREADMAAFRSILGQLSPWLAALEEKALLPLRRDGKKRYATLETKAEVSNPHGRETEMSPG